MEDTLEDERNLQRTLQEDLTRERRELSATKSQLAALQSAHSSTELKLEQANKTVFGLTHELDKEKGKSLSLAHSMRSTIAESVAAEQSIVSPILVFTYVFDSLSILTQLDSATAMSEITTDVHRTFSSKLSFMRSSLVALPSLLPAN